MKIYTEINYKWLDGQLVETDSKSFEYEGKLSLCAGGFGGGGGGGADPISVATSAINSAAETINDVLNDPVGTTTDIIGDTITTAGESLEPAAGGLENILGQTGDVLEEGLSTGVESMGMNDGVATTLGDFGDKLNEGITTGTDALINDDLESGINTSIADGMDGIAGNTAILAHAVNQPLNWLNQKRDEIGDFVHGSSSPSDVTIDPDKFAVDSSKKKKSKSDLAVNKSKKRARKSLRIG